MMMRPSKPRGNEGYFFYPLIIEQGTLGYYGDRGGDEKKVCLLKWQMIGRCSTKKRRF